MKRIISLFLVFTLLFALTSCNLFESTSSNDEETKNTSNNTSIFVDEDGHLVINGIKSAYKVKIADEVSVSDDGHLVVNGVKTSYEVNKADEITVSEDGYLVVNGVKTSYEVNKADEITVSEDGYLVVNGVKTDYAVDQEDVISIDIDEEGYLIINGEKTSLKVINTDDESNDDDGSQATLPEALVIGTDSLSGSFNPFYPSVLKGDNDVVNMTQIGMLTTGVGNNGEITIVYGDDEAVVVKDMSIVYDESAGEDGVTTYTFVIKNDLKFSDGHPLTIEDVLFNLYVYLDPVYSGSSPLYTTDIIGLYDYRTQAYGTDSSIENEIEENAATAALNRIKELILVYKSADQTFNKNDINYWVSNGDMITAINNWSLSDDYKRAVSSDPASVTNAQLLADYENTLKLFKEELYLDYTSAQEAYDITKEPYCNHPEFQDEIFRFMCYEGRVSIRYKKDPVTNNNINTEIDSITKNYDTSITTKDAAIDYIYQTMTENKLHEILMYYVTAQKLLTNYTAEAKQAYLDSKLNKTTCECGTDIVKGTKFCATCGESTLTIPSISGITSLGHLENGPSTVVIGNTTYKVAKTHDANGAPTGVDEYDVLRIKINGYNSSALQCFAFSVAPQHYYAEGYDMDIAKNNFGVDYNSTKFMTETIQSLRNVKLPMGAGAYKVTDRNHSDNPDIGGFFADNVVYFKANRNFMFNVNIDKVRFQVVSASNAIYALQAGEVHYITPQLTYYNLELLDGLKSSGIKTVYTDQLGYGYIGINADMVPDIELRKAIMTAMDTSLALAYYKTGTASQIFWPMSQVSWAYTTDRNGNLDNDNKHSDPAVGTFDMNDAKATILDYMAQVGACSGDCRLKLNFVIAGSNLTDHPTYLTFQRAADLLNECGWDIQVIADSQAFTKLSTGSLAVWAAEFKYTDIDIYAEFYQRYHMNSNSIQIIAWGYDLIIANNYGDYDEENDILNDLSDIIDTIAKTNDLNYRKQLYKIAMSYILDLAIELPVYQKSELHAYDSNVIDPSSLPQNVNPYLNLLSRIWEIKFTEANNS